MGVYNPATEKKNYVKIFRTKICRVHLDVLCVYDKFREKPTLFVTCVKRQKFPVKNLFLAFCLRTAQKHVGFP